MEIASFRRYAFIRMAYKADGWKKAILFFTPTEELHGSNIFSKLATKFSVIQPYLDMIDEDFIAFQNRYV